jgi:hypothetical protein
MRGMAPVFAQMESLIKQGTLGNSSTERGLMALHSSGLNQTPETINTSNLEKLGNQLVLARGSLGAGVSVSDAERYDKAAGDFTKAQSNAERMKYLSIMRDTMTGSYKRADDAIKSYNQTGSLPAYSQGQDAPAKESSAQTFNSLPNPAQFNGKRMRAPDGSVIRSNGKTWIKE